jgi:putative ABC transport system permease protein
MTIRLIGKKRGAWLWVDSWVKFMSLLIGFLVFIVIMSWVMKELSYDDFWENRDRIYRVALEQYRESELQFTKASNYRAVTDLMAEELPEVVSRVRLHRDRVTVFTPDAQIQDVDMFYADTSIFIVLKRRIVARESDQLFTGLRSVVISESLSRKIFGDENPIGKKLSLNEGWEFFVSAVFEDIPDNSHIGFDLLMTRSSLRYYMAHFNNVTRELEENYDFEYHEPGPYDKSSWGRYYGYSYVLLEQDVDINILLKKAEKLIRPEFLPGYLNEAELKLIFQPIEDIYLYSNLGEELRVNGSIFRVYSMILVAIVVLIISMVNFINISAVDFYRHSPTTAIRMIHGASIFDILKANFKKELIIAFLAGGTALLLAFIILDGYFFEYIISLLLLLFLCIIVSLLLTLPIPLYSFSTIRILDLLKGRVIKNRYGKSARRFAVFIQFSIAIFLISATIILFFQMRFLMKHDPGFVTESVVYSYTPMTMNQSPQLREKLSLFRNVTVEIPGVKSFCTSSSVPGKDFLMQSENVSLDSQSPEEGAYFNLLNVDQNYLETYGLRLIAGSNFQDNEKYPDDDVILNYSAAEKLGLLNSADALGKIIRVDGKKYQVIGVVEDFHHLSMRERVTPVLIFKSLQWRYAVGYYSFKIASAGMQQTLEQIGKSWSEIYPEEKFIFKFMEEDYANLYRDEKNYSRSVSAGAFLAIFISCLGLFSYSRYSSLKRVREIGIRKVFGASQSNILWQFNSEILSIIAWSSLLAIPVSLILMKEWLANFAYRTDPEWWMFLSAIIITMIIALATTFYFSYTASLRNPVDALKYE